MAQRVREDIVRIDVAKDILEVFGLHSENVDSIANEGEAIEQWLARWKASIRLAIEPSNRYQQRMAGAAHTRGHQVCMVDPYRLVHDREGIGQRVKAGHQDAKLLAPYVSREEAEIRLWASMKPGA